MADIEIDPKLDQLSESPVMIDKTRTSTTLMAAIIAVTLISAIAQEYERYWRIKPDGTLEKLDRMCPAPPQPEPTPAPKPN